MTTLREDLKQTKPFANRQEEVYLNVIRTGDALGRAQDALFKGADLTSTQYNVLRMLRGAGEEGLRCGQVAERLVTRDPDVTRLVDRLLKRGLISRRRDPADRRVVTTTITPLGLQLLAGLDAPVAELHQRQLGHLNDGSLTMLSALLERARDRVA